MLAARHRTHHAPRRRPPQTRQVLLIDRWGRRPLLLEGGIQMLLCQVRAGALVAMHRCRLQRRARRSSSTVHLYCPALPRAGGHRRGTGDIFPGRLHAAAGRRHRCAGPHLPVCRVSACWLPAYRLPTWPAPRAAPASMIAQRGCRERSAAAGPSCVLIGAPPLHRHAAQPAAALPGAGAPRCGCWVRRSRRWTRERCALARAAVPPPLPRAARLARALRPCAARGAPCWVVSCHPSPTLPPLPLSMCS